MRNCTNPLNAWILLHSFFFLCTKVPVISKFSLEVTLEILVENRVPERSSDPSETSLQVRRTSGPRNKLNLWVQGLRFFTSNESLYCCSHIGGLVSFSNIPEFQPHSYIYSSSILTLSPNFVDKIWYSSPTHLGCVSLSCVVCFPSVLLSASEILPFLSSSEWLRHLCRSWVSLGLLLNVAIPLLTESCKAASEALILHGECHFLPQTSLEYDICFSAVYARLSLGALLKPGIS